MELQLGRPIQAIGRDRALSVGVRSAETYEMDFPTPEEIAREAREALAKNPESPQQCFERLVRAGFINERGEVTTLLGGDVDPEPYAENKPKRRKPRATAKRLRR